MVLEEAVIPNIRQLVMLKKLNLLNQSQYVMFIRDCDPLLDKHPKPINVQDSSELIDVVELDDDGFFYIAKHSN